MTASINSITIDSLSKRYKHSDEYSLKEISFSIVKGERFGILGPNGAGKTTLISILCGILAPTSGSYEFRDNGHLLNELELKRRIGLVPQEYAFYEELTPMQNMRFFGAFYKLSRAEIDRRSDEIFAVLGLTKVARKKTKYFSGGLKRRMNLAIGIIHKPSVLFLDEPTVGADVQSKHAMMEYLVELNRQGTTMVYTSHHMSEAEEFCDRIAFIHQGKLIACDYITELISKHHSKDLTSLFISLSGEAYIDPHE